MVSEDDIKKMNALLNAMPLEDLHSKNKEEMARNEKDFQELKEALARGECNYCENPIAHFSEKKPCFHWLLKPKGFKKRHFPLLYRQKSFHQLEAYLRWVANCEELMRNINDLVEEKSSSKFIEETIRYKNLEWSFSCSHGDRVGHENSREGKMPHYHFQMRVDEKVIINYGAFHIPFQEYDEFSFAVKEGKIDRLRAGRSYGAGMQDLFDRLSPEELINGMRYTKEEKDADFEVSIMMQAKEGTTISGDEIADLIEERNRTGVSMAKLAQKLKNADVQTIISPGPGIPRIAARTPNRSKK